jgi:hypothetical protein
MSMLEFAQTAITAALVLTVGLSLDSVREIVFGH